MPSAQLDRFSRRTAFADRPVREAALASIAMAVPDRVVGNDVIAAGAGVTEQWIVHRTGVHERRRAAEGERLDSLAAKAGQAALAEAGLEASDLDLVLVATLAADELTPNAAPLVAHQLGADRAGAMDIGAACTGWLSGLSLACAQIEAGRAEHVLLIGAEVLSRYLDPADRGTSALFADGAGAAVVSNANGHGHGGRIREIVLRCDGRGAPSITAGDRERIIRMQGHDTFKAAVLRMSEATLEAVELADLGVEDIDLFVYHQANARILRAVGEKLGLDDERVVNSIDRYGNTSSATLPIALVDARERGLLQPGMNVLLAAFGAGFTWGAGVVEWQA